MRLSGSFWALLGLAVLALILTPAFQDRLAGYLRHRWPKLAVDPTQVLIGVLLGVTLLAVGLFVFLLVGH